MTECPHELPVELIPADMLSVRCVWMRAFSLCLGEITDRRLLQLCFGLEGAALCSERQTRDFQFQEL